MKRILLGILAMAGSYWIYLCYRNYHLDKAEILLIKYRTGKQLQHPHITQQALEGLKAIEPKVSKIMCHTEDGDDLHARAEDIWRQLQQAIAA